GAQSADRGAAASIERTGSRARRLRPARERIPDAAGGAWATAERCTGAKGAGTLALPIGFLRPAAPDPGQPAGRAHRRRPFRLPVGSLLRRQSGDIEAG